MFLKSILSLSFSYSSPSHSFLLLLLVLLLATFTSSFLSLTSAYSVPPLLLHRLSTFASATANFLSCSLEICCCLYFVMPLPEIRCHLCFVSICLKIQCCLTASALQLLFPKSAASCAS
ncbi:hypothetical protein S245_024838 [Arachis hypogaea]